jgi:hypothetical protein
LVKELKCHAAELVMAGVNWDLVTKYVDIKEDLDLVR